MSDQHTEDVWGPAPPRWKVLEARFWGWRKKQWWRLLKHTVCRQRGHSRKSIPVFESDARSWACARCQTQLRGPDGKWLVVFCVIDGCGRLAQWEIPDFFGPTQSALMCNFHAETFESVAMRRLSDDG